MYVHMYVRVSVCLCIPTYKLSSHSRTLCGGVTVLHTHACTYMRMSVLHLLCSAGLSVLPQLKASSEKEVASLKAHKDLEVGELNVRVRELSRQLQLASTTSSTPSPPAPTLTVQCSTAAGEDKPIAKRTRRKR